MAFNPDKNNDENEFQTRYWNEDPQMIFDEIKVSAIMLEAMVSKIEIINDDILVFKNKINGKDYCTVNLFTGKVEYTDCD